MANVTKHCPPSGMDGESNGENVGENLNHSQAGYPPSRSPWWCQAHQRSNLRGDPLRPQVFPGESHSRRFGMHLRPPQDHYCRGRRRIPQETVWHHSVRLRLGTRLNEQLATDCAVKIAQRCAVLAFSYVLFLIPLLSLLFDILIAGFLRRRVFAKGHTRISTNCEQQSRLAKTACHKMHNGALKPSL